MKRDQLLDELASNETFDLVVIGGGATGAGIALDAASRNYRVALIEREDFGSGTSSKSSKLVHGGVRYLANGEFSLVKEALRERSNLLNNAPHLVEALGFIIPTKNLYERCKYGVGLYLYDQLARDKQFDRSRGLSLVELEQTTKTLRLNEFTGAVRYSDAQFDDTRLLWDLVNQAHEHGAKVANYCEATAITKTNGKVSGVEVLDVETDTLFNIKANAVVNATGAWSDEIGALDDPDDPNTIVPSQGTHIVVDKRFYPADDALLIPRTSDGRVMFVIPWHGKVVIGTTDEKLASGSTEATPTDKEIDLILNTTADYLQTAPTREDISACFAGIRPLSAVGAGARTAKISREHSIEVSHSGLITISGGKWTTYRLMAEHCVDMFEKVAQHSHRPCRTSTLLLAEASPNQKFSQYGQQAPQLLALSATPSTPDELLEGELTLTGAEVVWSVQNEMARTLMDVLARRSRILFLDAGAAQTIAPKVAELMRKELGKDSAWVAKQLAAFHEQAKSFSLG